MNIFKLTLEQEKIIQDNNKYINVNGGAGCAKTETMIQKIKYLVENNTNLNILLITLVSSVTNEIKTRLSRSINFDENIKKLKTSNHYIGKVNNNYISIANNDSFIDCQLRFNKMLDLNKNDKFDWKKKKFYEESNNLNSLILKNGKKVNLLIIDEVQDLKSRDALALVNILKNDHECNLWLFGDKLQSIFLNNETILNEPKLSIDIFLKYLNFNCHYLTNCFRCPKSHINFINFLTKKWIKYYNLKELKTNKIEDNLKPYLFGHPAITTNEGAEHTSNQILEIIKCVLTDESISPGKISIITSSVNYSNVFPLLENKIKHYYQQKFGNELIVYFRTKEGEETKTIDLTLIKNDKCCVKFYKDEDKCRKCGKKRENISTSLISIHGMKGGENDVIIFFGLSKNSIPKDNRISKEIELNDKSLFNVACTRSKKYLFVGFNHSTPSSYLNKDLMNTDNLNVLFYYNCNIEKCLRNSFLNRYELFSAEELNDIFNNLKNGIFDINFENKSKSKLFKIIKEIYLNDLKKPNIFKNLDNQLEILNREKPYLSVVFPKFNSSVDIVNTPDKNIISATDIYEQFESYEDFDIEIKSEEKCFGEKCDSIKITSNFEIWGRIPELIIMKKLELNNKFIEYLNIIIQNSNVKYIDNIRHLSIIKDCQSTCFLNKNNFVKMYSTSKEVSRKEINDILLYFNIYNDIIFLPEYFKKLKEDIYLFLKSNYANINISVYFNIALLYNFYSSFNLIDLSSKINSINKNISIDKLIKNINLIIPKLDIKKLEVECCNIYYKTENKDILKYLNIKNSFECAIVGRIDAVSNNNNLYEFKLSHSDFCRDAWIIQCLIYKILGIPNNENDSFSKIKNFLNETLIINFYKGKTYKIDFLKLDKNKCIEIIRKVLDKYNYHSELKKNILNLI